MSGRIQNFQCLAWLALALLAVVKLDGQQDAFAVRTPRLQVSALGDTRSSHVPVRIGDTVPFRGFGIPDAMRDSIVRLAQAQLGRRYRFGGTSPERGFDCSGLVRYVLGQLHVNLPRLAAQQARVGEPILNERLRPGDLLSFGPDDTVSHIGIYVGEGRFVHASSVAGRVIVSAVHRKPSRQIQPLRGARRLLAVAEKSGRS